MNLTCAACGSLGMSPFYEAKGLPTQTCVLLDNRSDALEYPSRDLVLAFCGVCGFIQNAMFESDVVDYSQPTEESQAFSSKFNEFASGLADDLIRKHDLVGKSVLEVGCGKGDFLIALAEQGIRRGVGFDPGFLPNRPASMEGQVEFVRDWYTADSTNLTGDLVLSRHLMEHVPNVSEFLGWLTESASRTPDSILFTEVPDVLRVLKEGAFWDIYYEHCSYFTPGSMGRALAAAGLEVLEVNLGFEGQYVLATARVGEPAMPRDLDQPADIEKAVATFSEMATDRIAKWKETIEGQVSSGGQVVIWGGGSKAVAFLSALGVERVTVVDINPFKQGKWLPSVGVEVQNPEVLRELSPDLVIPMNEAYLDEIRHDLDTMGLAPKLIAV